tara:strand:+ start:54 stop:476 length:423 start_codon:yes stop_codon:yes gene_type:complete
MTFKDKIKDQLVLHEGLRLKPYKCTSGKLTIGVGRNLDDAGISEQEAFMLLDNDINKIINSLPFQFPFYSELNDARKAVLINMAFNIGMSGLFKFKNMLAAIRNGDFEQASYEMLDSVWAEQVGNRARQLANQMASGEWQ